MSERAKKPDKGFLKIKGIAPALASKNSRRRRRIDYLFAIMMRV